ncbi:hypothetical protein MUK51_01750 [Sphingobacterium faecium]|uniref:hypothetical protein n=1 Tax=Sphingobacterium faecium TaxID=34087 RepID=UPI0021B52910|nr:hypothetical protein [Sphingobacterium faecium]UXD70017.1 hypothetical protein MUK51_01750 [Sphingobacterium faecium]
MKNYLLLIILSFVPFFVFTQTHRSSDSKKLNEAMKAYFFIKGQELSLEYLEKNEPSDQNLKKVIYNANQYFAKAKGNLSEYLISNLGEKKFVISEDSLTNILFESINFETIEKQSVITEINKRTNRFGGIPENIKSTLIYFTYEKNPSSLINDGFCYTFSSIGAPKSKGTDFNLKIPIVFNQKEGNRPNIIQSFDYNLDDNAFSFNILIKPNEIGKVTKTDITELISSNEIKNMIPQNAHFIKASPIYIEECNGYKIEYTQEIQRLDIKLNVHFTTYMIFDKDHIYGFTFGYNNTDDLFTKRYQLLITSIMNTFVLNTNY